MVEEYSPLIDNVAYGDHTADVWLEATGDDLPLLIANIIHGLYGAMADNFVLDDEISEVLDFKGDDLENVMVDLLSELLFLFDAESRILIEPKISIKHEKDHTSLRIQGQLIKARIPTGKGGMEIKAVTYHDASVEKVDGCWRAKVLLDI
jgi:SHS2 domain-containing protein